MTKDREGERERERAQISIVETMLLFQTHIGALSRLLCGNALVWLSVVVTFPCDMELR